MVLKIASQNPIVPKLGEPVKIVETLVSLENMTEHDRIWPEGNDNCFQVLRLIFKEKIIAFIIQIKDSGDRESSVHDRVKSAYFVLKWVYNSSEQWSLSFFTSATFLKEQSRQWAWCHFSNGGEILSKGHILQKINQIKKWFYP